MRSRMFGLTLLCILVITAASGCRTIYYNVWETFGKEKRDLLVDQISATTKSQHEVRQEFKDTLEKIRHNYKFDGGSLEKTYDKIAHDFDRAEHKANGLKDEIKELKAVARDLFREWRYEAATIKNKGMRQDSLAKLKASQQRFDSMLPAMEKVEKNLDAVLANMQDHKLYMKHNLNSRAVASLRSEMGNIEKEINKLITDIGHSIAEVERFAATLNK